MSFIVKLFSVALFLHIAVIRGESAYTEENVLEKRTPTNVRNVAQTIFDQIKGAGYPQIGFLYLHGSTSTAEVGYGNADLETAMTSGSCRRNPLRQILAPPGGTRPSFYPLDAGATNLLVALPDEKGSGGEVNNHGHSEYKLLQQIDALITGYKSRNRNSCPAAIILGTYHSPCFRSKTRPASGCAIDYRTTKERLTGAGTCPRAAYYIFIGNVPKKDDKYYDNFQRAVGTLASAAIEYIPGRS